MTCKNPNYISHIRIYIGAFHEEIFKISLLKFGTNLVNTIITENSFLPLSLFSL